MDFPSRKALLVRDHPSHKNNFFESWRKGTLHQTALLVDTCFLEWISPHERPCSLETTPSHKNTFFESWHKITLHHRALLFLFLNATLLILGAVFHWWFHVLALVRLPNVKEPFTIEHCSFYFKCHSFNFGSSLSLVVPCTCTVR